jgi:hypothetical protein
MAGGSNVVISEDGINNGSMSIVGVEQKKKT